MISERTYYVYALKDPLLSPSLPFYIGKGTGVRAWEHELQSDESSKGKRIAAIHAAKREVSVVKLVDSLIEVEALRIEAELISSFGVESRGGLLTNVISPYIEHRRSSLRELTVPSGVYEKAQLGVRLLKDAVLEFSIANLDGVTNSDVAHTLGLQSDYLGGSKDYLSWSVLGLLMREGRMKRGEKKRHKAQVR